MPEVVSRDGFAMIGLAVVGNPKTLDYHDIWTNQFRPREPELRSLSADGAYYEAFFCVGKPEAVEMVVGVAVRAEATPPAGLVKRDLPAATYAVFKCTVATIGQTWNGVDAWLSESDYEYDDQGKADFEYYPPDTAGPDDPVQIYVAVRMKA